LIRTVPIVDAFFSSLKDMTSEFQLSRIMHFDGGDIRSLLKKF
jgi:hypothetical protein